MESTDYITLKCALTSTDFTVPLGMRILLDDQVIYENSHVAAEEQIEHKLSDADAEHELTFELFGKLAEHTKINEAGEIVKDALLSITAFELDEIDIFQVIQDIAVYYHDFNGTKEPVESEFHGDIGCNGKVKFKFNTPVYLWLLENM